jgi:hypothetical protein
MSPLTLFEAYCKCNADYPIALDISFETRVHKIKRNIRLARKFEKRLADILNNKDKYWKVQQTNLAERTLFKDARPRNELEARSINKFIRNKARKLKCTPMNKTL